MTTIARRNMLRIDLWLLALLGLSLVLAACNNGGTPAY
jgi:hypothetical protein